MRWKRPGKGRQSEGGNGQGEGEDRQGESISSWKKITARIKRLGRSIFRKPVMEKLNIELTRMDLISDSLS
jgi:hypothetical protein